MFSYPGKEKREETHNKMCVDLKSVSAYLFIYFYIVLILWIALSLVKRRKLPVDHRGKKNV